MNNRRKYRRILVSLAACALLAGGCARYTQENKPVPGTAAGTQASLPDSSGQESTDETIDALALTFIEERDRIFSYSSYSPAPAETLGEFSLDALTMRNASFRELKTALSHLDTAKLDTDELLICKTVEDQLNTELLADGLELYTQPLEPENGIQIQIPQMFASFELNSSSDISRYLALMGQMPELYESILKFEQEKAEAGLLTGGEPLELIIQSLDPYMVRPDSNPLTQSFASRLEAVPGITEKEAEEYKRLHRDALKASFIPACRALSDGLNALKSKASSTGGLASMPMGRSYFSYLVEANSGCSVSVPELLSQTERRLKENLDLMTLLSDQHPEFEKQADSYQFSFPDTGSRFSWLCESTKDLFPAVTEDSAALANLMDMGADLDLVTLAGKGWPGLFYRSLYYEERQLSPLRLSLSDRSSAAVWECYAERFAFADGNGLSPELNGFLLSYREAANGLYALMDIHLNYDGWSREQFEEFCTSYGFSDADVIDKLYCEILASPGHWASRYAGFLSLTGLKREAQERLGENFSLAEFHTFLLDMGPVSLRVIEPYFKAWMLTKIH